MCLKPENGRGFPEDDLFQDQARFRDRARARMHFQNLIDAGGLQVIGADPPDRESARLARKCATSQLVMPDAKQAQIVRAAPLAPAQI